MAFWSIAHIVIALVLIVLVLIQDSKSGAVSGTFGGGNANSLLGATGATTLASKATRWTVILFALTCLLLTRLSSQRAQSALDAAVAAPSEQKTSAPVETGTPSDATAPGSAAGSAATAPATGAAPAAPEGASAPAAPATK
jgi:preprotein translocase subunit SecG